MGAKLIKALNFHYKLSNFCEFFLKGCGKSVLVQQFANFLGYNIEPVVIYQVKTMSIYNIISSIKKNIWMLLFGMAKITPLN